MSYRIEHLCLYGYVEGLTDGAVAERAEVHLEAGAVECAHRLGEQGGFDETESGVGGGAATAVEVGLQHSRGEVLRHAVLHDLHAGGVEAAHLSGAAALRELGKLFQAAFAVPPQGADDAGEQRALTGRAQIVLASATARIRPPPTATAASTGVGRVPAPVRTRPPTRTVSACWLRCAIEATSGSAG
ncbi:hypothetical protein Z951_43575 [Streptomyces sp. PRh5]|nr:hypothetical protein Z951_43575 [Streptomyces sp. PRh5]